MTLDFIGGRESAYNMRFFYGPHRTQGAGESLARVAELVDALDLGSSGVTRESSSLSFRTKIIIYNQ